MRVAVYPPPRTGLPLPAVGSPPRQLVRVAVRWRQRCQLAAGTPRRLQGPAVVSQNAQLVVGTSQRLRGAASRRARRQELRRELRQELRRAHLRHLAYEIRIFSQPDQAARSSSA